jgi:hypothetical protein
MVLESVMQDGAGELLVEKAPAILMIIRRMGTMIIIMSMTLRMMRK